MKNQNFGPITQESLLHIDRQTSVENRFYLLTPLVILSQAYKQTLYHTKQVHRLVPAVVIMMLLLLSIDVIAREPLQNNGNKVDKRQQQAQARFALSTEQETKQDVRSTANPLPIQTTVLVDLPDADKDQFTHTASSSHSAQGQLTLHEYVKLAQQKSFTVLQHQQQLAAQTLSRKVADQYFVPTIEFSSNLKKGKNDTYLGHTIDNNTTDLNAIASINWQLPSGAKLATSYQYQDITHKTNALTTDQTNGTTTVSVEQPIIGGLWHNLSHLPQAKAKYQWQYYQTEQKLLALTAQRDALVGFLDFQTQFDLIKLLADAAKYAELRTQAVTELFEEGMVVQAELVQSRLALNQRQAALKKAQDELILIQDRLSAKIDTGTNIVLQPLVNIEYFLSCTKIDASTPMFIDDHPELRLSHLQRLIKHKDYEAKQFHTWPQVSMFYEYKNTDTKLATSINEDSWGMRASFQPFNTAGRLSVEQLRTAWLKAGHDMVAKHKQLKQQLQLKINTHTLLRQQLVLAKRSVQLAQKAFQNTQEEYQNGTSDILDIRQAQDKLTDLQKDYLDASKTLLNNLFDLYYSQGKTVSIDRCTKT